MTVHTMHFTITGEYLTTIARDAMLSELPGQAYRMLRQGLVGPGTADLAEQVLAGTHDLAGDSTSGITVVEAAQTPELERYLKDLSFIYAGRYRDGKGWRRPVAVVVGFNRDDARYASEKLDRTPSKLDPMFREWTRRRVEYYCTNGERVTRVRFPDGDDRWVIWEPCSEMPQWVRPPMTEADALASFLERRTLEERSAFTEAAEVYVTEDEDEIPASPVPVAYWRNSETEEEAEERERKYQARLAEIGEQVRAQAGDDTLVLTLEDGTEAVVPRAPFVRWALRRTHPEAMPEWRNVSHSGMKMPNDDPNHSDWMLGAGLSLDDAYNDNITGPAYGRMFELQDEQRNKPKPYAGIVAAMQMLDATVHKATVLVDKGVAQGVVGGTIAVFPDSKPERVAQMEGVEGVIVERGGQIAHFAIVTRELGITVLVHPNACELFPEGTYVTLNPKTGRIVIEDDQ